jgi:hypothetical protein
MVKTVINIRNKEAISILRAIYVARGRKTPFLHAKNQYFCLPYTAGWFLKLWPIHLNEQVRFAIPYWEVLPVFIHD